MDLTEKPRLTHEIQQMYRIPGQDIISQRSLDRYAKIVDLLLPFSNPNYLRQSLQPCTEHHRIDHKRQRTAVRSITGLPIADRPQMIRLAFQPGIDPQAQSIAADMIKDSILPSLGDQSELILQALQRGVSPKAQKIAASRISDSNRFVNGVDLKKVCSQIAHNLLESEETEKQLIGFEMIRSAPIKDREALAEEAKRVISHLLKSRSPQTKGANMASMLSLSKKMRAELIDKVLNDGVDPQAQSIAASMVRSTPAEEQTYLKRKIANIINRAFKGSDREAQLHACQMIYYAPSEDQIDFKNHASTVISRILSEDTPVPDQKLAVRMIAYAAEKDQLSLIQEAMQPQRDLEIQIAACSAIVDINMKQRLAVIRSALDPERPVEVQIAVVKAITRLFPEDQAPLLHDILRKDSGKDAKVKSAAIKMIHLLRNEERTVLIETGLQDTDPEVQSAAAEEISSAPSIDIARLIKEAFKDGRSPEAQLKASRMIKHAYSDEKGELFREAKEILGDALIQSPLYSKEHEQARALLVNFEKTGSETIVAYGPLYGKAIFRIIDPGPALSWVKAFEAKEVWEQNGFSYVPVEPILKTRIRDDGKIVVASGILDISAQQWENMGGNFMTEINSQIKKIEKGLASLGIIHGHLHPDNFCLRFERDDDEHVDFTKVPKVYVIDFDDAFRAPQ